MSVFHDHPKWPTPPRRPAMPSAPSLPMPPGVPIHGFGPVQALKIGVVVGIPIINAIMAWRTHAERKAKHDELVKAWSEKLPPVGEATASNQEQLNEVLKRFRSGEVGPGSRIIIKGPYRHELHKTYEAFCDARAKHRAERVKAVTYVVKAAALTTSIALGPLVPAAKAAIVVSATVAAAAAGSAADHKAEHEAISKLFDLAEVIVSSVEEPIKNKWNNRILMALVSAKLVHEIIHNGAYIADNDGETMAIKWGDVVKKAAEK